MTERNVSAGAIATPAGAVSPATPANPPASASAVSPTVSPAATPAASPAAPAAPAAPTPTPASPATPTPAIEFRNLAFSYGREPFIENLSASFRAGAITSIVGPNGCGKSTLVKLMDGLHKPSAGEVLIDGIPIHKMNPRERAKRLAVLAQAGRVPSMTVEALVACGRHPYQGLQTRLSPEDREQVEQALQLAGIERFRHHNVRLLSGGERQRAFIAMTLAQDTSIIVLDEPTTFLDIHACHETMQLVRSLNARMRKTFIMVIHDLDLALRYSDAIIVMERGSLSHAGSIPEVLASGSLERTFHIRVCPVNITSETENNGDKNGTAYVLIPH
ncbi:MAG: ABC transporter ATP-binding protein [Coriobacteriales bacterium]|jgi:iron complex transport system ATP-binding protein|nr:ABC transporter ATP-binding protein [Coriobacteriales bacterium]